MKIKELIDVLEQLAPKATAEDFDNVGLLTGNIDSEISGILVTLDCLESVVDECILLKYNTIVTFHPIILKGLKSIIGKNYIEKAIIKAIQNHINIFAIHTNLDNAWQGVNEKIAQILELQQTKILIPKEKSIFKLTTYIPNEHVENVKTALFDAGAGAIGNYAECSFSFQGKGSFKPLESSNPFVGNIDERHYENETCFNITFEKHNKSKIIKALQSSHPYEEVAYEIMETQNTHQKQGMGKIGNLSKPISEQDFLHSLKENFFAKGIRHSALLGKNINKVAVLGGSGNFAIAAAIAQNADILITADIKYHEFFQAENKIVIADIGHYESEQFTKNLLFEYIQKKIPNIALRISEINTNPINYF